jgi:hypothetical protein
VGLIGGGGVYRLGPLRSGLNGRSSAGEGLIKVCREASSQFSGPCNLGQGAPFGFNGAMSLSFQCGFLSLLSGATLVACATDSARDHGELARSRRVQEASSPRASSLELGDHSVLIASHLYSLADPGRTPQRPARLAWSGALEAFGQEVERIDPAQLFLLGDNTRNARDEEWALVERVLEPLGERVQFAAGNHDSNHLATFAKHDGVRQGVKLVGPNKYIQLDCVKVFDAEALEFIKRELADVEQYEHVFVLMHYFLAGWDEFSAGGDPNLPLAPGQDPNSAARQTNWKRDVLPLLAGKVDAVFVGDYRPGHVRSMRQDYRGESLLYVLNSFGFGYDEGIGEASDGPLIFVELRFEGEGFSILPRAVPLDLRHGYYGFSPRMEIRPLLLDWAQLDYGDAESGVALKLGYQWKAKAGPLEQLRAWVADPLSDGKLTFSVSSIPLAGQDEASRAKVIEAWLARVLEGPGELQLVKRAVRPTAGQRGLWASASGQLDGRPLGRWSQVVMHRGKAWIFTLSVPGPLAGEYLTLWQNLISHIELSF